MTSVDAPVPLLFDAWEMFKWFSDHGHEPTPDELTTAMLRVGRIPALSLLESLFSEGMITPAAAAANVASAWSMAEYPDTTLDREVWRGLFELAGYTVDDTPADRPSEPLVLWRGSLPEARANWSWTDSREVAQQYADGGFRRAPGALWTATVAPWRLLARQTGRQESEYVVDTAGLEIHAA